MNIDKLIAAIPAKSPAERAGMRANVSRWQSGTPDQRAAADELLAALDRQETAERDALVSRLSNLDVGKRVVEAFTKMPPTETERKVLQALLDNPGSLSSELSQALGWEGAWHAHFGSLCHKRQVYLWPAPDKFSSGRDFYTSILADFVDMHITLKPDVAAALATIGIRAKA
jgi:hypothetical protein